MFREHLPQERLESANDNIYVDINKWTTDLSEMPTVTLKGIHKYFITDLDEDERPRGAEKHNISGYQLFKDGYVMKVKVKARVKADMSDIFVIKNCHFNYEERYLHCSHTFLPITRNHFTRKVFL